MLACRSLISKRAEVLVCERLNTWLLRTRPAHVCCALRVIAGSGCRKDPRVRRALCAAAGPRGHFLQDGSADGQDGGRRPAPLCQAGDHAPHTCHSSCAALLLCPSVFLSAVPQAISQETALAFSSTFIVADKKVICPYITASFHLFLSAAGVQHYSFPLYETGLDSEPCSITWIPFYLRRHPSYLPLKNIILKCSHSGEAASFAALSIWEYWV